jgi:hypothetical protein
MPRLFRAMKENAQGYPEIGASARTLGVRPGFDVPAHNPSDLVQPGQGGLSVSPDNPMNLPYHRRPPDFQGVGKDPAWVITSADLGPNLSYRPDPAQPGHGFVEPVRPMTFHEYQDALAQTQGRWRKVGSRPDAGSAPNAA